MSSIFQYAVHPSDCPGVREDVHRTFVERTTSIVEGHLYQGL